jgi:hypothetical protein
MKGSGEDLPPTVTEQVIQYRIVNSFVHHYIPFVRTRGVVTEGFDNHMRGTMVRKNLYTYRVEGDLINSHGSVSRYMSNWFYLGSPTCGIFFSIGKASGYPNRTGYAPYVVIGCSYGLRDWGIMLGKWRWMIGVVYVSYWREYVSLYVTQE